MRRTRSDCVERALTASGRLIAQSYAAFRRIGPAAAAKGIAGALSSTDAEEEPLSDSPLTDRLMSDLRGKLESISNSAEKSRAFKAGDPAYATWLRRHADNGYVLHRKTASVKTSTLHRASCPLIGGGDGSEDTRGPRVGSASKPAAMAFALRSKWKVLTDCDRCTPDAE